MSFSFKCGASLLITLGWMTAAPAATAGPFEDPVPDAAERGAGEELPLPAPAALPAQSRFREMWRVPLGAPLSGPLLVLDSQVVASAESGAVQGISLPEGRPLWKADLAEKPASGPVLFAGVVIQVTASGKVIALDPSGGSIRWTSDLGDGIRHEPTPTRESILVPLAAGRVVSMDAGGKERWRVTLRAAPSTPVAACRGFAVVGTEAGSVEAFDRETGRRLWVFQAGAPVRSPLLCYRGRIYFGTGDYRFNALGANGRRKWSYRVGGDITTRPFGEGRRIHFLCYDNFIYALRARSGHLLLKVRMSHRLAQSALRVADRIYLSPTTSARLVALSLPDLQLVGEYKLELEGEWFTTPPVQAGDQVLIGYGRYEGRILALKEEKVETPVGAR